MVKMVRGEMRVRNKKEIIERYGFDRNLQEKAKKYEGVKLLTSLCQYAFLFMAGFLTLAFGISAGLERFALNYTSDPWLVVALYFVIGFLCFWLVSLPFDYYKEYVVEHRFDLSVQTRRSWMGDKIKELVLGISFYLMVCEAIYYFIRTSPTCWWVPAWILISVVNTFIILIFPVLIAPLFLKYTPIKDEQLIGKLTDIARKAGLKVLGVYEEKASAKTRKINAALVGVGKTRRMFLYDTLLSRCTSDEIEAIVAHELGHHVRHVFGKMISIMVLATLPTLFFVDHVLKGTMTYFGLGGIESIATLPLFLLSSEIFSKTVTPLTYVFSRNEERQADRFALEITYKPDAFISSMIKVHDQNLGDADPHPIVEFLFHNHPAGKKRVEHAIAYKKSME